MTGVTVIGAGVVGQVYAGLLADAGNEVSIVARGDRAEQLRASGVVLEQAGRRTRPACRIVGSVAEARAADTLIVAVRGDQLPSVLHDLAAAQDRTVVCLGNPLGHRADFEERVGRNRAVFAFSGIGGLVDRDGVVRYHVVPQQPTVVDVAAPDGPQVARLMKGAGLPVRAEKRMAAWLATHTVFIAGIGAELLAVEGGAEEVARSRPRVRELVVAMSEAFDALQRRGHQVRPGALRTIFGRVPVRFAVRYWTRQFAGPTVRVSIEPHVLATRDTEFRQLVDLALDLVGGDAPRYRALLESRAASGEAPGE